MKNLPCIVFLAALASLVLLAAASSFGLSLPFLHVASMIVGFSGAAGVLALFLADYGRRPSRDGTAASAPEAKRASITAVPAGVDLRGVIRRKARQVRNPAGSGALTRLRLSNDPATLSLV